MVIMCHFGMSMPWVQDGLLENVFPVLCVLSNTLDQKQTSCNIYSLKGKSYVNCIPK